ncbi:PRC-barrel domain-containing protein [Marivita sp.]|uniref:PRC-barrel domain-containing protein n=1 Tax=Marivita sp. TaxID=2003365 RepID=UPI003F6D253C
MTKLFVSALALTIGTTGAWAESHSGSNSSDGATMNMSSDSQTAEGANMTDTTDTQMADATSMDDPAKLIRTRDITGGNVYTMNAANDEGWSMDTIHTEASADWNDIGEIEDIVMNESGQMTGIVAEIGGFLDIADKHVMISVDDVNLVAVDDRTYAILTKFNEEDLEQMQSVDEGFWN